MIPWLGADLLASWAGSAASAAGPAAAAPASPASWRVPDPDTLPDDAHDWLRPKAPAEVCGPEVD